VVALVDLWPVSGIRLRTADLDLRVITEADLPEVVVALPDDVEMDPAATTYAGLDRRAGRGAVVAQAYWGAMGTWSPGEWRLPFLVRRRDRVVGIQWLEGPAFLADQTVDSASWLCVRDRGRGYGQQMRGAVLELAFRHLGASAAISSAVLTNAASLGVSRSLGYVETHTSVLEHSGETLQHVRLERAAWESSGRGRAVRILGADAALPFFGLGEARG
jgi:RimJ/RimL family protein N-acetyltransferase